MHFSIYPTILLTLCAFCCGLRYGKKSWRPRPRCNQFDPPAVRNLNFDDIAGKWHLVRLKTPTTIKRDPTKDSKVEWLCGTNKAIRSFRLLDKPNYCVIVLREFMPIPGTYNSAFSLFLEETNITIEWRLLHFDSKFIITWGCFARDSSNRCTDWGSGLLKRTPNATISDRNLRRLDIIIKRATCDFTITKDYKVKVLENECRDWELRKPQSTDCSKRY